MIRSMHSYLQTVKDFDTLAKIGCLPYGRQTGRDFALVISGIGIIGAVFVPITTYVRAL
jgi:hypothetical protein